MIIITYNLIILVLVIKSIRKPFLNYQGLLECNKIWSLFRMTQIKGEVKNKQVFVWGVRKDENSCKLSFPGPIP